MTIIVATRDFIAADSKLSRTGGGSSLTVGKIFRRKGGGLFATAGDCRRTYHFEKSMRRAREPEPLECLEDEDFEAVVLLPDKRLIFYDSDYSPAPVAEESVAIGGPVQVVRSWMLHDTPPILALQRAIEVDSGCGYPITVAYLDGRTDLIDEAGNVTHVTGKKKR